MPWDASKVISAAGESFLLDRPRRDAVAAAAKRVISIAEFQRGADVGRLDRRLFAVDIELAVQESCSHTKSSICVKDSSNLIIIISKFL